MTNKIIIAIIAILVLGGGGWYGYSAYSDKMEADRVGGGVEPFPRELDLE